MVVSLILSAAVTLAQAPDAGEGLTRPTMLALDYKDVPMAEVIKDVTARTGCRLSINEEQEDWLATRITLRTPAPLPFWSAVDAICKAGRFGCNLGLDGGGTTVAIFRGYAAGPFSDHGPFRVVVDEVSFNGRYRQLHLKDDGGPESAPIFLEENRENSYVKLSVWVEPRMLLKNAGKLKGLTAVDERGRSLLPPDPTGAQESYGFGFTPAASTLGQVPLARVKDAGRVIKTLRGVAPVAVAGLRREPLSIPLAGAAGTSFRGAETVVTVRSVAEQPVRERIVVEPVGPDGKPDRSRPRPRSGIAIALSIRSPDRPGAPAAAPEVSEHQFEVVDAAGKVWTPTPRIISGDASRAHGREVRYTVRPCDENLSPMPWPGDLKGVTLRYREMTVVPVDVPFAFTDVPLP